MLVVSWKGLVLMASFRTRSDLCSITAALKEDLLANLRKEVKKLNEVTPFPLLKLDGVSC